VDNVTSHFLLKRLQCLPWKL